MSSSATSLPVEPFDAYVRRRARSAVAWTRGETVTAAVGLLRGCRRATGRSRGAVWWITAEGRPVLVPADSGPDVVEATAEALAHVGSIAPDDTTRDLVARTRESVLSGPPREWEEGERRLFAHAAPTPLVLGPLTPVIAETPPTGDDAGHLGSGVTAFVDADLAEAARAALADLRERWRRAPRRRAAAVGVLSVAAVVVAAAALLPLGAAPGPTSGASAGSTAARPGGAAPATAEPTPRWSVDPRMPLSDDSEKIARALFAEIEGCRADTACVTAHEEGSSFTREPLLHGAAEGDISLIEDFGGVVVVRVADETSAQYVTLVRLNDRWLVRAVETVTDQPS